MSIHVANEVELAQQLSLISNIEVLEKTPIQILDYNKCTAHITKVDNQLKLYINGVFSFKGFKNELSIELDGRNYILKSAYFITDDDNNILSRIQGEHTYEVYGLKSENFTNEVYANFRSIFPLPSETMDSFIFTLEREPGFNRLKIDVHNNYYYVTQTKQKEKGYYIIENHNKETFSDFEETCFAIQQALGFLTKYMPGGEQYVFAGDLVRYTSNARPAMKSIYYPVTGNAYSIVGPGLQNSLYEEKLKKVPATVISNLVSQILNTAELSSSIILLMEAGSARSLLMIPSIFAVIIEALSKIIGVKEEGKVVPIIDIILRDKIIEELDAIILKYEADLGDVSTLKLRRRINEINKPLQKNRLTNNEKLTRPFEQLGIKIDINDVRAIEHRNDLLHGNVLMSKDEKLSDKEINSYMMYVADRLYTLISKLILKNAGYSGYIINQSKFSEQAAGIKTEEGYFVEI